MTTRVIVPVKGQWQHTSALLACLAGEDAEVLILDNDSPDNTPLHVRSLQRREPWRGRLKFTHQPDVTIYEMWNTGFAWAARGKGERYVLVTNNDIELPPGALGALAAPLRRLPDAWVSYPDYDAPWSPERSPGGDWVDTRGVLSDGGMFGACFMLAAHRIPWRPLITDLSYEWWYGDNHLAEEIEQHGGKQVRVVGLPVRHVNEGTAATLDPNDLYGRKFRDRYRWINRYERKQ